MSAPAKAELLTKNIRRKEMEQQLNTVWTRFFDLIKIPYPKTPALPQGDATQMLGYFENYAKTNRFDFEVDDCQNACISVEASYGHDKDREIVVQGHHDAVFVGEPDPSINGVNPVTTEDGKWVKGDTTNLTADNRLGVALTLTAVENLVKSGKVHGPVKILLTAGEDSGLIGATYLGETKSKFLDGNQTLINVDSSEGPEWLTIGCASGSRDQLTIPVNYEAIGDKKLVKFGFSGFPGGHSGLDIGKDRPSSIRFFAELFADLKQEFPNIGLASLKAGEAFNSISVGSEFILTINVQDEVRVQEFIDQYIERMKREIPANAPEEFRNSRVNIKASPKSLIGDETLIQNQMDKTTSNHLINVLLAIPQGVGEKEGDEILSSNNIGTVEIAQDKIIIQAMTRGKETSFRDKLREQIKAVAKKENVLVEEKLSYRHWSPQPERLLIKLAKEIGEAVLKKEIKTRVSLGGLEPGIFEGVFPGLEAISISAARIENEHSLAEQAEINSLEDGYTFLTALLTEIPKIYS